MKAVLIYNLPEDRDDFELAQRGLDWYCVAWDLDQWIREQVKYKYEKYDEKALDAFDLVRDTLRQLMNDRGVSFE
jgi:hypothetical protein